MSPTSLTDAHGDRGMLKVMGMVLFSLCLLSLFLFSMARLLGVIGEEDGTDPVARNALIGRIEPIGRVRTSAEDLPHGDGIQVAAGGGERSGEELVQGVCAGCHVSGAGGAPMLDDEAAWAERRETGLEALVASVINGKGAMPARGGSDYSDEEIRLAVQHIALFEDTGESEGEDSAEAGAQMTDGDAAEAPVAASMEETDGTVTKRDVAGDEAKPGEVTETALAADVGSAEVEADASPDDLIALIGSGETPEGLPEHVKGAVDGVCAGCHVTGVANAPKLGDKEAWAQRAEAGLDALTQTVINGKGAMPARGGTTLSDEEIPVAIQYLVAKQP